MTSRPDASAIALDRIEKRYGATVALSDATFAVAAGAVHALLGENGAGKSTLVKILSGIIRPDSGTMRFFGQVAEPVSRGDSSRLGLETAFQEIPLVPDLTVAQNILLPDEPRLLGFLRDRWAAQRRVERILSDLDLPDIDPLDDIRDLDLSVRQKVEIARAISRGPKILLLDEPSAALSSRDVEWLGERIAALRATGTTIVLVTHRMQEVREYCDSLSVLRNGSHVGSFAIDEVSDAEVFSLIMGRSVEATFPRRTATIPETQPLLEAEGVRIGHRLRNVSLSLSRGEILGVAALQGMGQLELFTGLFGVRRFEGGAVKVDGVQTYLASPRDAIRAGIGIGLVPEDRKIEGLALEMTGRENASLPAVESYARFGWIDHDREQATVDEVFAQLQVHPRAHYLPAGAFSGGNQQKIVLAKWMLTGCKVLLVFDPTRGVDVGTKHEIYLMLRKFADAGGAVLFYSTEVPEIVGLSDRVVVLYRGEIGAELRDKEITESAIGMHMLGFAPKDGGANPEFAL
jgi:ribose transport system ATP-binding protein